MDVHLLLANYNSSIGGPRVVVVILVDHEHHRALWCLSSIEADGGDQLPVFSCLARGKRSDRLDANLEVPACNRLDVARCLLLPRVRADAQFIQGSALVVGYGYFDVLVRRHGVG